MENTNSVSVLVTCYNSSTTIADAIASAINQSTAPAEIIVIDDGSIDNSCEIIESFGSKISLIKSKNMGPSGARNRGLEACTSSWVAFLDGDDIWHPDKLTTQLSKVMNSPGCNVIASDWSRNAEHLSCESSYDERLYASDIAVINQFQTSTVLARRGVFEVSGMFDRNMDTAEDWDMWLRLSKLGYALLVHAPMVYYRDNPNGVSKDVARLRSKVAEIMDRELSDPYFAPTFTRTLRAWHHQRFVIAAILARDFPTTIKLLRTLPARGSIRDQLTALRDYTFPFLFQRVKRRTNRLIAKH